MTQQLDNKTGAPVTVRLGEARPIGTYTANLADGTLVGRADFVDSPDVEGERMVFHTEVDPKFSGRGLARILVRGMLADSIRRGITVVPACPLLARHLREYGEAFVADGGRFRRPTPADTGRHRARHACHTGGCVKPATTVPDPDAGAIT